MWNSARHRAANHLTLALAVLLALASAATRAQSYNAAPIERDETRGILWWKEAESPMQGVVVLVPGAQMTGDRYTWLLEALVHEGFSVVLPEAALEWITPPGTESPLPARYVRMPHALAALDFARAQWPSYANEIALVGHSLGGAIVLEMLDPAEASHNPRTNAPEDFAGVSGIAAAVILGTSLQSTTSFMTLPHRSDSRPLHAPGATRLLFLAAENDAMATPALMRKTAARYDVPVEFRILPGGNHLNWSEGLGMMDRPDFDGEASISEQRQLEESARIVLDFLQAD